MIKTLTVTSPAAESTAASGEIRGLDALDAMRIVAIIQGGTGGTLDITMQIASGPTENDSPVWVDYLAFAQLADGAAQITRTVAVSRAAQQTTLTAVAVGNTPALAANTVLGGDFGERCRFVMTAGAGTSAGKAQTFHIIGSASKRRV